MHPALVGLVERCLSAPIPFYRERLRQAGIESAATLEREAWQRLPPTTRSELVADQLAHLTNGRRHPAPAPSPVRAGATGTGSELLVLTWTKSDLAAEREAGVRLLRSLGAEPRQRVANTLSGALATPGSLMVGDIVDELGALDIPLGAVRDETSAKSAWKLIDRVEANVLIVDHDSARALFSAGDANARAHWHGTITVLASADAPYPPHSVPDECGFTGWQRFWIAVPEAGGFLGASCGAGSLHIDRGLHVEIVDAEGTSVVRGDVGSVLVTPLARDHGVLRYASGLRAREIDCACGNADLAVRLE